MKRRYMPTSDCYLISYFWNLKWGTVFSWPQCQHSEDWDCWIKNWMPALATQVTFWSPQKYISELNSMFKYRVFFWHWKHPASNRHVISKRVIITPSQTLHSTSKSLFQNQLSDYFQQFQITATKSRTPAPKCNMASVHKDSWVWMWEVYSL